jgi:alpha-tubulin suppressor-like RCC1 family protein
MIATDGSLYTWGRNAEGQCSQPTQRHYSIFRPQRVDLPRRITVGQISCGDRHTAFVATDGSVFSCGENSFGQLGQGSEYTTEACSN